MSEQLAKRGICKGLVKNLIGIGGMFAGEMDHPGISVDRPVLDEIPPLSAQHQVEAILRGLLFPLQLGRRKPHTPSPLALLHMDSLYYKRIEMHGCSNQINSKGQDIELQGPQQRFVACFQGVKQAGQNWRNAHTPAANQLCI